jgi:hypothetical protein
MYKSRIKIVVVLVFASYLFLPAAANSTSSRAGLIRIFSETEGKAFIDLGKPGRSAGDRSFFGTALLTRGGKRIGYSAMVCTYLGDVLPGTVSYCNATYVLPRGKIMTTGTRQRRDYYVLAVVGGTGIYSTASGMMIASTITRGPRVERLFFSLET